MFLCVKVRLRLDLNGILSVQGAEILEEWEEDAPVEQPKAAPATTPAPAAGISRSHLSHVFTN